MNGCGYLKSLLKSVLVGYFPFVLRGVVDLLNFCTRIAFVGVAGG